MNKEQNFFLGYWVDWDVIQGHLNKNNVLFPITPLLKRFGWSVKEKKLKLIKTILR